MSGFAALGSGEKPLVILQMVKLQALPSATQKAVSIYKSCWRLPLAQVSFGEKLVGEKNKLLLYVLIFYVHMCVLSMYILSMYMFSMYILPMYLLSVYVCMYIYIYLCV